ncbi:MAG: undecaprenyl-diphosphate phosphatase [Campylobacterota bacterium]|nr:undecaprenyl-diphosphate phosphatase [Campylobacterota bacterium]
MDIFQAIIIGIIEGFTEFLPISSTGHMIVAGKFLGIPENSVVHAYEIIIQFSAILAVMLIYREKISLKKVDLWMKLMLAFMPFAIVGFLIKDYIDLLFNAKTVAYMFIIGGVVFLIVEYFYKEKASHITDVEKVNYKQALYIGISQVFAIIPGTSRSGATIIGGLLSGLDRKASSDFSFLLAIPVMGAVSGYSLLKHYHDLIGADFTAFVIGFVVSFVVAYITVKLFLVFIQRFSFVPFGIYRIIFGIILLMVI